MDDLIIFKTISLVFSLALLLWSWRNIHVKKIETLFTLMISAFFLSTVLFFEEGRINDWLKHIPFYVGQLLFYLFLKEVLQTYANVHNTGSGHTAIPLVASGTISQGELSDWFVQLTDQGLQHIITLPLFVLIVTVTRVYYGFLSKPLKTVLNLCMLAGFSLTMIHIGEFIVESQEWMPFLEGETIEIVEFLWFYLALLLFGVSIAKLSHIQPVIKQ